jgi:polysaccharide chain length determinant protein (PEP-CTERM system associated)
MYLVENDYEISRQINDAQQKLDDLAARRSQLTEMRDKISSTDPIHSRLAALQRKLQELSIVYNDNYPEVIEIKNQIASTREQVRTSKSGSYLADVNQPDLEKIAVELKSISRQERNLKRIVSSKQALQKNIPTVRTELDELEQDKLTQQRLYNELMGRYGQSEVSKQMQLQDKATTFRIVDPAITPAKPFSPNRVALIFLGIIAGFAGSFAILVLLDYLDNTVRHVDTFKSMGVPVLAVVPKLNNSEELKVCRKRDRLFFSVAVSYFSLVLLTLSFEYLRQNSVNFVNPVVIRQNMSLVKEVIFKHLQ